MTRPEHYIAAEELLEDVGHARDEDDAARVLGIAEVHATLALIAVTAVGTRDIDNRAGSSQPVPRSAAQVPNPGRAI